MVRAGDRGSLTAARASALLTRGIRSNRIGELPCKDLQDLRLVDLRHSLFGNYMVIRLPFSPRLSPRVHPRSQIIHAPRWSLRSTHCAAFSLIEVCLALGLATFALMPMIGLISNGMSGIQDAMTETVRTSVIRAVLSEARSASWQELNDRFGPGSFQFSVQGIPHSLAPGGEPMIFRVQTRLEDPPSALAGQVHLSRRLILEFIHIPSEQSLFSSSHLLTRQHGGGL